MWDVLWSNWIIIALVAPFFWALVNIIDVYVVHGVYQDEFDGGIIAGLFQLAPWLFVPLGFFAFQFPPFETSALLFLSGFLFLIFEFYYFKTLFVSNDVTLVQILLNTTILVVPFIAWLFIGELLATQHYFGLFLAFLGSSVFYLDKKIREKHFTKIAFLIVIAVVLLAFSMVTAELAYRSFAGDFWSSFLVFCLGGGGAALLLLVLDRKKTSQRVHHIMALSGRYFLFFLLAEGCALLGRLAMQRTIDISPAVSYVTVFEAITPLYVVILSWLIIAFGFFFQRQRTAVIRSLYKDQSASLGLKMLSSVILITGIYLISS